MVDADNANTTNGSSVMFTCAAEGGPDNVFVRTTTKDSVDSGDHFSLPTTECERGSGTLAKHIHSPAAGQ